ncbi:hypothetical protein F3Y22_tig00117048pilonHSYRG00548 [Hibiscus syriacus]|uniref:Uncharacterized protein n=1 Tax=Hibiscus syriacus TaxID=106335 RepID=A0A6A2W9F4_HIBSY|nr:hypothetical protein F3Y22_tig00117048pilonHSYRG00548 [Hibiscus syriacus]
MEESGKSAKKECSKQPAASLASKYTCPGCYLRTCSLPRVNAHKQRTGCNEKKNITSFVPLSKFDDNLLIP